ncbi:hypothetical protein [Amycolatopsis sp.]|uniref:hypothetical protein n=1 Tax=Amycolatopsis sp. TaxID=37632 RepID=UPI002628A326|nr:hypothetical protein [Amycolatopsis sp.]
MYRRDFEVLVVSAGIRLRQRGITDFAVLGTGHTSAFKRAGSAVDARASAGGDRVSAVTGR